MISKEGKLLKVRNIPGLKNTDNPKSIALRGESSLSLTKRKFSGLRSRCMTPKEWQASITPTIVLVS
jgi:hypothetical protein